MGCVMVAGAQSPSPSPIRNAEEAMTATKVNAVPNFVLPPQYRDRTRYPLPSTHSNANSPYFGPHDIRIAGLWEQQGMSCGNAQSVSCVFNHEANKVLRTPTPAGAKVPNFTYFFTYQFLNDGGMSNGDAWMFFEALDILKEIGGATTEDFGPWQWGMAFSGWMSGYEKYYRAMKLRVDEYYDLNGHDAGADEAIKQVLYDHADGSPIGANLVFRAASGRNTVKETIQGRQVMKVFNNAENHALSIVGWDDTFLPELGGTWIIHNTGGEGERLWYVPRNQLDRRRRGWRGPGGTWAARPARPTWPARPAPTAGSRESCTAPTAAPGTPWWCTCAPAPPAAACPPPSAPK
jgi:hypothetical protein